MADSLSIRSIFKPLMPEFPIFSCGKLETNLQPINSAFQVNVSGFVKAAELKIPISAAERPSFTKFFASHRPAG
jgi:hypothetical protein